VLLLFLQCLEIGNTCVGGFRCTLKLQLLKLNKFISLLGVIGQVLPQVGFFIVILFDLALELEHFLLQL